jgi:hypothetical protein
MILLIIGIIWDIKIIKNEYGEDWEIREDKL